MDSPSSLHLILLVLMISLLNHSILALPSSQQSESLTIHFSEVSPSILLQIDHLQSRSVDFHRDRDRRAVMSYQGDATCKPLLLILFSLFFFLSFHTSVSISISALLNLESLIHFLFYHHPFFFLKINKSIFISFIFFLFVLLKVYSPGLGSCGRNSGTQEMVVAVSHLLYDSFGSDGANSFVFFFFLFFFNVCFYTLSCLNITFLYL